VPLLVVRGGEDTYAAAARRQARLIERRGAARDHPALLSLPESLYLKCFILEVN
jgi:23S rRNA (cytosine1962-C5)-methyltransferase